MQIVLQFPGDVDGRNDGLEEAASAGDAVRLDVVLRLNECHRVLPAQDLEIGTQIRAETFKNAVMSELL